MEKYRNRCNCSNFLWLEIQRKCRIFYRKLFYFTLHLIDTEGSLQHEFVSNGIGKLCSTDKKIEHTCNDVSL